MRVFWKVNNSWQQKRCSRNHIAYILLNNTWRICLNVILQTWNMFLDTGLTELYILFVSRSTTLFNCLCNFLISRVLFFLIKRQTSENVLWRSYFLRTSRKTSVKECIFIIVGSWKQIFF